MISLDDNRPNLRNTLGGNFENGFILVFLIFFPLGRLKGMQNKNTGKAM